MKFRTAKKRIRRKIKWYARKIPKAFKNSRERKEWRNLKWFTPYEVGIAMVTHGQKDPQFKWGETIKYSPAEVEKILNEVGHNEN